MKQLLSQKMAALRAYNSDRTNRVNWVVNFTRLSILLNAGFALGKIAIGIYSHSLFLCVNGLFNAGISLSKFLSIRGYQKKAYNSGNCRRDMKEEHRRLYQMGIVVIAASAVYLIYCVHMMTAGRSDAHYNDIAAITIAVVTFTEIGVAARNFLTARKSREPLMEGMKLINLATSLISLVLTQTALMSLSDSANIAFACGLTGVIFGSLSAIIGLYLTFRGLRFLVNENNPVYQERFNRYLYKTVKINRANAVIHKTRDNIVTVYARIKRHFIRDTRADIL